MLKNKIMAKKELKNSMMGQDMKAMLRGEAGISEPTTPSSVQTEMAKDAPRKKTESKEYERFNFVCSTELAAKARAISRKDGFTIRALMEKAMTDFFEKYEAKNGKIKLLKSKDIEDVL